MSNPIIKVENLSKAYQIGQIGTGTISRDLERFVKTKILGKEDPFLKIGESNDQHKKGNSDIVWSLKDINFEINQGDAVGIIGKNGAGKSTLLKILSRITAPTTGNIKVKGRIASLLEVGTGFHPELSGRENIYLNGAILGMRKKEISKKLDQIIDFSGVERYIDTPVKRYSSGMYVRLAFAVAAHLESEILIVDEVLAVGDAEFQKKCLGKMGDISKGEGRTVLFVSHNMAAVQGLCNAGLLLKNGKIEYYGHITDTIKNYFVDQSRINALVLKERIDRKGNGNFKFENIEFLNKKMQKTNIFFADEEMNILIKYNTLNNKTVRNVIIGIAINSNDELQICTLSNHVTNEIFEELHPNNEILCTIKKLHLVSGNYNINLFSKIGNEISDWIINTCTFTVESGDYYKTGKNLDKEQSLFLLDYNFKLLQ